MEGLMQNKIKKKEEEKKKQSIVSSTQILQK